MTLHENIKGKFHNEKGFTLVEVILALSILVLISFPVYDVLINGLYLHQKAETQYDYQTDLRKVMFQITDGFEVSNIKYAGLRSGKSASNITNNTNLLYVLSNDKNILYFLKDAILYRYFSDSDITDIPSSGYSPILTNVESFTANINEDLVNISIVINAKNTKDINLETTIKLRNFGL